MTFIHSLKDSIFILIGEHAVIYCLSNSFSSRCYNYFLEYSQPSILSKTIFNESQSTDENILSQLDNGMVELLLHGGNKIKFQQNCSLVNSVQFSG